MKHIKLLAAATCILLATAACKKDETPAQPQQEPEQEQEQPLLLRSVIHKYPGGTDSCTYHYDEQGRCTSYYEYGVTGQITYNTDIVTETLTTTQGDKERNIYYMRGELQPDSVVRMVTETGGVEKRYGLTVIAYNSEGLPSTVYVNVPTSYTQYILKWLDGNMVEAVVVAPGNPKATFTYTYDNAGANTIKVKRPLNNMPADRLSKNPATGFTRRYAGVGTVYTEAYTYAYDDKGRIIKKTTGDGSEFIYSYR